jgi:hypothetical protein
MGLLTGSGSLGQNGRTAIKQRRGGLATQNIVEILGIANFFEGSDRIATNAAKD